MCTQTAGSAGVLYVWNHAGFRMFRGAVTGNFRDREIAGNCLLKNLPAKCGELLTVSTVLTMPMLEGHLTSLRVLKEALVL